MKTLILSAALVISSISITATAEIKPVGSVQEYACAMNQNVDSDVQKICFSQIVGEAGQFLTTRDVHGVNHLWRISEQIETNQIGKGDQKLNRFQVQQIGFVENGMARITINTEVLTGKFLQVENQDRETLLVDGEIFGQKITASQFQTFDFTLGQPGLGL